MDKQQKLLESLELEYDIIRKTMLNHGFTFDVPKLSILRFIPGKKRRKFKIESLFLNTMDHMAEPKLLLNINLVKLEENALREKTIIIKENNRLMSDIIAIAVLNRQWKIKWFKSFLSRYFNKRMNAALLHDVCNGIDVLEDAANFINSTVLMAGNPRTTTPKAEEIEKKPAKAVVKQ